MRITTTTQENIEAVRQVLERSQGRISTRRNRLGISPSSFFLNNKERLTFVPIQNDQAPKSKIW